MIGSATAGGAPRSGRLDSYLNRRSAFLGTSLPRFRRTSMEGRVSFARGVVCAWSLAARQEALREVNDRRHIYLGSSGSPFSCYYSRSLVS
jgi:hypothetical protein